MATAEAAAATNPAEAAAATNPIPAEAASLPQSSVAKRPTCLNGQRPKLQSKRERKDKPKPRKNNEETRSISSTRTTKTPEEVGEIHATKHVNEKSSAKLNMASSSSGGGDNNWEWTKELYHHKPRWDKPSAYEERGLEFEDFMQATQQQNEEGLPVQLEVPEFTWKSHRKWDLLMIICKPLEGFKHRSNMAKTVQLYHEGWKYHISLCFVGELPEEGWDAYQRFRRSLMGKRAF